MASSSNVFDWFTSYREVSDKFPIFRRECARNPAAANDSKVAIVIDNGSFQCRAGWSTEKDPRLVFPSVIAKPRSKLGLDPLVGVENKQIDLSSYVGRTQFDNNLVYHYDMQETVFDHIFMQLGITSSTVQHPVVMTEPVCNPNYCRKNMSELLFECYQVPSVCYGVDALFSYYNNLATSDNAVPNGLVISSSYMYTHVLPILNNKLVAKSVKRLSLGGKTTLDYMQNLLQTKYPVHRAIITTDATQRLLETHTYIAPNYADELQLFASKEGIDKTHIVQLPKPMSNTPVLTEEEKEKKHQARVAQGLKLKEILENKRKEKKNEEVEHLAKLEELYSLKYISPKKFQKRLEEEELFTEENLDEAIKALSKKVKTQQPDKDKPATIQEEFPLIGVPDDQLTPEQKKEKKKQLFLKNTREGKAAAKQKRKETKEKQVQIQQSEEEKMKQSPKEYVANLHKRRKLLNKREKRLKVTTQSLGRNSVARKQRMKALVEAENDRNEDTFGMNDDDWNVYLVNQADEPESEDETNELTEVEALIAKYDKQSNIAAEQAIDYELHLSVDRIRVPELLFQPQSIGGIDQMGITETIFHALNQIPQADQSSLMKNVFICGGNTFYPGFADRMLNDLRALRPVNEQIVVSLSKDRVLDAWRGAAKMASSKAFSSCYITKQMYDEKGHDYLREHWASNSFVDFRPYTNTQT